MNPFALASLFAGIVNVSLAVFVFTRKPRSQLKALVLLCGCAIAVWNIGAFAMFITDSRAVALFWSRTLHLGVVFLPVLFFDLSVTITGSSMGKWRLPAYILSAALAVADLTPWFIEHVRPVSYGWYGSAGPAYWVFSAIMPLGGGGAIFVIFRRRRIAAAMERRQLTTLLCATALLLITGTHDVVPVWGYDRYPGTSATLYPWGTLGAGLFGVLVAYAILQDQMLEVRITLSRGVATIVRLFFLLSIAFVFLFAIELTSIAHSPTYVIGRAMIAMAVAALVAGFLFPKLFGATTETLERRILGDTFEYQEQLRALIRDLDTLREHNHVIAFVNDMLGRRVRLQTYAIVLLQPESLHPRTLRVEGWLGSGSVDWSGNGPIFRQINESGRAMIELRLAPVSHSANDLSGLVTGGMEYVFAVRTHGEAFGVVAVGRKTDGASISLIDRELLGALATKIATVVERIHLADQAALAARLEHVAMMSRGLAHDLNNLITPISSFLVHVDGKFPAGTAPAEVHRHATRSVKVMQDYIRDAMFFGKRLAPKMQSLSLQKTFFTVRELTAQRAALRGVNVGLTLDHELQFIADPLLIQRLLTNLVNNAIDASQPGQTVLLAAQLTPCHRIRLRVSDQGCGISEMHLARIFEPYFTTKQFGDDVRGFGLGLSICRKIADLHHGDIAVESKVGGGTTITVELPAQPPATAEPEPGVVVQAAS
jgi:signal transduction histidine kinase